MKPLRIPELDQSESNVKVAVFHREVRDGRETTVKIEMQSSQWARFWKSVKQLSINFHLHLNHMKMW
ncbi:hypothetical protein F183_A55280 (plasmid) [Bryobacterales bacterium F-183]|nr:hypothetical protein F183_A55280 [Bryobacterales bacterium F-183]